MKKYILILIVATCGLASCDILNEKNYNELSGEGFFISPANIEFAVLGCYDNLQNVPNQLIQCTEIPADRACIPVGSKMANAATWESGIILYNDAWIETMWVNLYSTIQNCNLVLDNIENVEMDEILKNRDKGEVRFIRGWCYLMLTNLFKDVPLRSTSNYGGIFDCPKTVQSDIYEFVLTDFKFAEENLYDVSYGRTLDGSLGEYETSQIGRATKDAAIGMQALTYLYRAKNDPSSPDWQNARDKALQLINRRGGLDASSSWLSTSYASLFRPEGKFASENIFGIYYSTMSGEGTALANNWAVSQVYSYGLYAGTLRYTIQWYNKYFMNRRDNRNIDMIQHEYVTAKGVLQYWPKQPQFSTELGRNPLTGYAFKDNGPFLMKYNDETANVRNNCSNGLHLLRYSEVLLIFAEAENEINGPTADAYKAVNAVRLRAGAVEKPVAPWIGTYPGFWGGNYITPATSMTKEEFRQAVLDERDMELFQEGKRLFDLNRREIYGTALAATKDCAEYQKVNAVRDNRIDVTVFYLPIPKTEMDSNKLISNQ